MANPLSERLAELWSPRCGTAARQIDEPEERQDFTAAADRLEAVGPGHRRLARTSSMADSVYWIERSSGRSRLRITLAAAPIDVGPSSASTSSTRCPRWS